MSPERPAVEVLRNPRLDEPMRSALVSIWTRVSNAGGAVGFVPPVSERDVALLAEGAFARVEAGTDDLVVAVDDDRVVGLGFLTANDWPLHRHWGTVRRLQRDPDARGRGIGGLLLEGLEHAGRDRGYERIVLTVRGGTGREGFYLGRGFVIEARLPGRIRLAADDVRDELVLSKVIGAPGLAAGAAGSVQGADTGAGTDLPEDDDLTSAAGLGSGIDLAPGADLFSGLDPAQAAADQAAVGRATSPGPTLRVRRLDPRLPLPRYAHAGDAGLDLHAREDVVLAPGERAVVPTGVAIAVPPGCVGLVHPRSGLAARHGVALVNAPGTIDAGYRGEVKVIVVNLDPAESVHLARGDRIAQLVVQRVEHAVVVEVADLDETARGQGGFGSSGR